VKDVTELFAAIGHLAWPALVLFLLLRFSGAIGKVVDSAARRKFSLKIAGNELSMEEFSEQQIKLLGDLQAKVDALEGQVPTPATQPEAVTETEPTREGKRLLWVDDNPRNNSYLVALLEERGDRVDIALSTNEALRMFSGAKYDAIVSDMGRPESDHAGIELARKLRLMDRRIPIFIFCGSWAARNLATEALQSGVNYITSSSSQLLTEMSKLGLAR
jgi:CheY-like chemotaxis protein